jgi:hypothetical protein
MGKLTNIALTSLPGWGDTYGGWTPPTAFSLNRDETNAWSCSIGFNETLPATRNNTALWPRIYVDPNLGSDSNSGQTQALALRNFATALQINSTIYGRAVTATNATPIVVTDNGHPFVTGDEVTITGAGGAGAAGINNTFPANPSWVVTVVNANSYSLDTSVGVGAVTGVIISLPRIILTKPDATWLSSASATVGTPWNGTDIVANTIVMPWDGAAGTSESILSMRMPPSTAWVKHNAMTWKYTVPATPAYVFDLNYPDKNGNGRKYTVATTIAEVETTPFSWYVTGGVLYVNTNNVAVMPDSNLHVVRSTANGYRGNSKHKLWLSRIVFEYSDKAFSTPSVPASTKMPANYTDRCRFTRATNQAGLYNELPCYWYHFGSKAHGNESDGFSYRRAKAVEVDCHGYNNGNLATTLGDLRDSLGTNSNQGSTIHFNTSIIRVGGYYYGNNQGLFDTSADATYNNAYSWNFGVRSYDQIGRTGVGKEVVDFGIGSTNTHNENGFYFDCKNSDPDGNPSTSTYTYRQEQQGKVFTNFDLTYNNNSKLSGSRTYVFPI